MPNYAGIDFKVSKDFGPETATRIFSWLAEATSGSNVEAFLSAYIGQTIYITPDTTEDGGVNAAYAGLQDLSRSSSFYNQTLDGVASDSDTSSAPEFSSVQNIQITKAFATYGSSSQNQVTFPYYLTPDGKEQIDPARALFHELAHAVTTPGEDKVLLANYGDDKTDYAGVEALAIAAEDLIYVQDHDGSSRVGHDPVFYGNENIISFNPRASFSNALNVSYSTVNSVDGGYSGVFTATEADGGEIEKIYGDRYHLLNFVTIVGSKADIVGDGDSLSNTFNDAVAGMLHSTSDVQLDLLYVKDVVDSTLTTLSSQAAINITSTVASLNAIANFSLSNLDAVIGNSDERFIDNGAVDNYVGPVDPTTGATVLGFSAGKSGILIGGSGLTDVARLTPGVIAATDNITAFKTGNSVLLAGDGPAGGGSAMNELTGGDDTDIFVGGAGNDDIHADNGADIVIQSRGNDHVSGNGETVFAVDQGVAAPIIDTRNTSGDDIFIRDAEGGPGTTTLQHVHTFVGNSTLTTFYGNGSIHELFIAGSGGGDFYLTKGDVAIGSSSAPNGNIYRVSSDDIGSIGIINFGPKDKLYIDGNLFTGVDQTVTVLPKTDAYGYDGLSVDATSSYGVYRPDSKKLYDPTTGTYDYGDSTGEYSDISYKTDSTNPKNGVLSIFDEYANYDFTGHIFVPTYETLKNLNVYIAGSSSNLPGIAFNYTKNGQGEPLGETIFTLYQDQLLSLPLNVSTSLTQMLSSILVDQTPDPSSLGTYSSQPSILSSSTTQGSISKQPGLTGLAAHDNASGRLDFADPDVGDLHHVTILGVSVSGDQSDSIDNTAAASWLTLGSVTEPDRSTPGSVGWTFSAPDSSFDGLSGTTSVTLTYHVQITDRSGSLALQDLTVTISGPDQDAVVIRGTDGDDQLSDGGAPSATLIGGLGNNYLRGGDGSDTYVYARADGNDEINDYSPSTTAVDTLRFTDLDPSDVTFTRQGVDLYSTVPATGKTIKVDNAFYNFTSEGWGLEKIVFADGTVWSRSDIQQAAWYRAGNGDKSITLDGSLSNTAVAGAGDDYFQGGDGSDTYIYGKTDGNLEVYDYSPSTSSTDTLKLIDLSPADATFSRQGDDLDFTVNATGKTIRIDNEFHNFATEGWGLEQIVFADGETWNRAAIQQAASYRATATNNRIVADASLNNTLVSGPVDSYLQGGSGSDTYIYGKIDGNLELYDYSPSTSSTDTLKLTDLNPADVTLSRQGDNLAVTVNTTGKTITIDNEFRNFTTEGWGLEQIVFANAETWNRATIQQAAWYRATATNNSITADGSMNNTLVAGPGDDYLRSGDGSDTYVYGTTDGNLELYDYSPSTSSTDTLKLTDLNPADVTLSRQGDNLDVTVNTTGKTITIDNEFRNFTTEGWGLELIVFADAETWNRATIQQAAWYRATATNNSITADGSMNNTLVAGPGDDYLRSGDGSDTYVYGTTDGNLELYDYSPSTSSTDTLKLTDLSPADITMSRQGDDLYVTVKTTGKTITIDNEFRNFTTEGWGLEQIVFADAETWNRAAIQQAASYRATATNNRIVADASLNNTLVAGPVDSYLQGGSGSDTYVYGTTDGNLELYDYSPSTSSTDTLKLTDLSPADITMSRQGDDLYVTVNTTGKTITIDNEFRNFTTEGWGLEQIVFANAETWNRATIQQAAWYRATATNNSITADGSMNNTLVAGPGDDYLRSGDGSDTYVYARGDGNDEIYDGSASTVAIDTLKFTDLNVSDVSFGRDGDNAFVTILSTGNKIKLDYQFYRQPEDWGIDKIVFADGTTWDRPRLMLECQAQNGTPGADSIAAQPDALVYGRGGNDTITGSGTGTAGYLGRSSDYAVIRGEDGHFTVVDSQAGRDGDDDITGLDRIQFADGSFTLSDRSEGWVGSAPTINDRALAGSIVGAVAAFNAAPGSGVITYSIQGAGADDFAIDAASGVVTVAAGAHFDALTAPKVKVDVIADDGSTSRSLPLIVNVSNVGDGPVGLSLFVPSATPIVTQAGVAKDLGDGSFELTPAQGYAFGAVWGNVDLSKDAIWTGELYFGANDDGGDGIGFSLTRPVDLETRTARSYGVDVPGTFGIRFATWSNTGEGNPSSDFGQFVLNGDLYSSSSAFSPYNPLANVEDGAWHPVQISWNAATHSLSYSIDGSAASSKSYDVSSNLLDGSQMAAFGFGASTGAVTNDQRIKSVSLLQTGGPAQVDSGALGGTKVAVLRGIDGDPADTLTYRLVDVSGEETDDAIFELVGDEIRVKAGATVTDPAGASHQLRVEVANQAGATFIQTTTIKVVNPLTGLDVLMPDHAPILGSFGTTVNLGGDTYQLTPDQTHVAGNIWGMVDLSTNVVWSTSMYFGANNEGADGIAFALSPQAIAPQDTGGGSLGVLDQGTFGLKFDTYRNVTHGDPDVDFAQFILNGNIDASSTAVDGYHPLTNIEDGSWHDVKIAWDAADKRLSYYLDGHLIGAKVYDIAANLLNGSSQAYFAFGAATGDDSNVQQIRILSVANAVDDLFVEAGAQGGDLVAILSGVDRDANDGLTYNIVDSGGNAVADDRFEIINGNELRVKQGVIVDASDAPHSLDLSVMGASGGSVFENVTIGVRTEGSVFNIHSGDSFFATSGSDLFIVPTAFGAAEIEGFAPSGSSHDVLQIGHSIFSDWQHLLGATRQVGSDIQIAITGQDLLTLKDISIAAFKQADVHFV